MLARPRHFSGGVSFFPVRPPARFRVALPGSPGCASSLLSSRFLLLLLALAGLQAAAQSPGDNRVSPAVPQSVPVFVNGKDGYGCYRIPALVTTLKGTIIAMADGRISGCGDIPNPLKSRENRFCLAPGGGTGLRDEQPSDEALIAGGRQGARRPNTGFAGGAKTACQNAG